MKSKNYFIKQLCKLRKIDSESEEASKLNDLKIVDILIEIKKEKEKEKEEEEEEEEEEDFSFSRRVGCIY